MVVYDGTCSAYIFDNKYLGDDGEIDLSKFTPITYDPVHHGYYRLGERVGNAFKDGAKLK